MIRPAPSVSPELVDVLPDVAAEQDQAANAITDWSTWRTCRVCRAGTGEPCVALSGRVAGGRPDGVPIPLPRPHGARRRRVRR